MRLTAPKLRVFLPIFAMSFLTDCASKRVAVEELSPAYVPHEVLGDVLRFTLAYNVQAAMGLSAGAGSRWILALIATAMVVATLVWLVRTDSDDRLMFSALALIAGGAAGNLLDRLRWDRGVVDFIDVGLGDTRFYIFNVADAAITVGAVLLWFAMRNAETRQHAHTSQPTA